MSISINSRRLRRSPEVVFVQPRQGVHSRQARRPATGRRWPRERRAPRRCGRRRPAGTGTGDDERHSATGQGAVTLAGGYHAPYGLLPRLDRVQRRRREDRRAVGRRREPRGGAGLRRSRSGDGAAGADGHGRRRHGDARDHSRHRARRAAVLRDGVHVDHIASRRTSATCAPPAATSSWTTSATTWRRRFRTARPRASSRPTNGGVVIQAVKDVTAAGALYFSLGRQRGQPERRHVGRVGRRLRRRRRRRPRRCRPGTCTTSPPRQTFNTLTVAGSGPINLFWSDPLGGSATTTTCSG